MRYYSNLPGTSIGWEQLAQLLARGEIYSIRIVEPKTPDSPAGWRAEAEVLVRGQGFVWKTLGSGSNLSSHSKTELLDWLTKGLAGSAPNSIDYHLFNRKGDALICGGPIRFKLHAAYTLPPEEFLKPPSESPGSRCHRCRVAGVALGLLPNHNWVYDWPVIDE